MTETTIRRLWRFLTEMPAKSITIESLAGYCGTSKTKVRLALGQLEDQGLIRLEEE